MTNGINFTLKKRDPNLLMRTAMGKEPLDILVKNASVVNVYTGEVQNELSIGVKKEWIAFIGKDADASVNEKTIIIDATEKTVIPGFIDGHTHLAWLFSISEFLNLAMRGGTTTIITESLEPYPVAGYEGVLDFLDSISGQPIKIWATAPAMVSISHNSLGTHPEDLEKLLHRDDILGLGESYWQGVFQHSDKLIPELTAAAMSGKTLEGHTAGAKNNKLVAYTATGVSSCHEPITAEEVLERLRLGIYVMAREGSIRRDLEEISKIKDIGIDLRRLTLVTDGVEPTELQEKGYMEYVVQKAIDYGFDPIDAIQMATINVAEHFSIDHLVGGISPGKQADMVIIPDLKTINAEWVISKGKIISKEGQLKIFPRVHNYAEKSYQTVKIAQRANRDTFAIVSDSSEKTKTVRVIHMVTDLVTSEKHVDMEVVNKLIHTDIRRDILKIAAVDRSHHSGNVFIGLIQGFGLQTGAIASSAAWDCSDIIAIGTNDSDMAAVVNRINELQGGAVFCDDGRIVAEIALPIFGLMTDVPMFQLTKKIKQLNQAIKEAGVSFPDPLLSLITLTGAAIPFLRICDEGLVNLKEGLTKGLFV